MYRKRQEALIRKIKDLDIESLVVTKLENIFFLCGFSGTTGILLVSKHGATLIVDPRYTERAAEESSDVEIFQTGNVWKGLLDVFKTRGVGVSGYEEHAITVDDRDKFGKKAVSEGVGVRLEKTGGLVEQLRLNKDQYEIGAIRTACDITVSAFHLIMDFLVEGATEKEIASELYCFMHQCGVDKAAFDVIVAGGERSAMPHAGLSDRRLKEGDLVMIDMGVCHNGYFSDMTRTFSLGTADETRKDMYEAVLKAQKQAVSKMRPGMTGGECDALSRDVLRESGYASEFLHGLGHGVGLEVHEAPALAPKRKDAIEENMIFTVEPGVYKKGLGGVRIEDTVLMTKNGAEVLTDFPKELIEL